MAALLLFPGAGSNRDHGALVAIEQAVTSGRRSITSVRADFPYRRAGRRPPDRSPVLLQAVRDELAALPRGPVVLGGRSMGGRMCSMVVGDEHSPFRAAGLVLVSYPLHPPGKPDKLRVEHLPRIQSPCLFIHGTRDPFGSPEKLLRWTAHIPGPVEHVWIERGTHDLKGADQQLAAATDEWIRRLGLLSRVRRS